ncbi:MAG: hypothetical protein MSS83_05460 [Methanobrevibacter sp.]|uniref:hypothetical protein n=1 Tax=Methanobrevibacter sp. TaxID=66852 RepID=UPI0031F53B8D|nr:hypothetical protein [Methanobrevibacter sp.]
MSWSEILSIIMTILTIVSTIVGYYFNIKQKLLDAINGKIDEVEGNLSDGKEKMEYVVSELYKLVPIPYRSIFNKSVIEKLVQKAFDKIEDYAEKQVNKKTGK